ncbi:hypothetical protein [Kitasatospora sp. NPDC096204]|uniref:hypothetical protein n=1 Tax=Kitasatospora sp. NPDC096204 TaxID=3364094 RepID=UPI00382B69D2
MNSMNDFSGSGNTASSIGQRSALQEQYEDQVVALVIRDLTSVDPAATVGAVDEVVAEVWEQAAEHVRRAGITWTRFVGGAQPQMAGC